MRTKGIMFVLIYLLCTAILTTIPTVLAQVSIIEPEGAIEELWVARYDGPANRVDCATGLAVDGSGNVYVTGVSTGSGTSRDYVTVKYGPVISPVAESGPDQTVIRGDTVIFDGSGSHDPDGTIMSYEWDFGDGEMNFGEIATHVYGAVGVYTVTLTVTDDDDLSSSDMLIVSVIPDSVSIGDNVQFGQGVSVGEDVTLGDDVVIGDWVVISENVDIEDGAQIGSNVIIGEDVKIGEDVVIGDGVEIGEGTLIMDLAEIDSNVIIGENVKIGKDVVIGDGVEIGQDTVIQDEAQIGSNVIIGENVNIGKDAVIGEDSTIGDNVQISNGQVVPPGSTIL